MSNDNFNTLDNQPTIPGEPSGQILSGRYRIIREIGSGGMSTVYLAEDIELDNMQVAVKVLPTLLANNKRAIDNLRREAKTALKLSHPNIVRLHTFQSDEAIKYLVMEYVDGGNLEEKVLQAGALSVDDTFKIFIQVAAGLDYAHSRSVLHRDIKPANIMLTKDGKAKLADFGIARHLKDSMTRITGKETSGTLLYMAPEQFRGGEPDHRSDIYSLAASIYECLSGHPPFWRGSIEYQIMNEQPAPLKELSVKQNAMLLRALSKDLNDRPKNTKELMRKLGASQTALDWQSSSKSLGKKSWEFTRSLLRNVRPRNHKANVEAEFIESRTTDSVYQEEVQRLRLEREKAETEKAKAEAERAKTLEEKAKKEREKTDTEKVTVDEKKAEAITVKPVEEKVQRELTDKEKIKRIKEETFYREWLKQATRKKRCGWALLIGTFLLFVYILTYKIPAFSTLEKKGQVLAITGMIFIPLVVAGLFLIRSGGQDADICEHGLKELNNWNV